MARLLALFVGIPLIELWLLIELGQRIGTLATLGLIVVTGIVGASLARAQGLHVWRQIQADTAAGRVPAAAMVDGVLVLVAGAVLLTPGVLTDAVGFALLVPRVRSGLRRIVVRRLERAAREGQLRVEVYPPDLGP